MTGAGDAAPELVTTRDTLLIIPTHNHPAFLPMAVESAQNQTVEDIDIVVVGDGVGDDTRDVMSPIAAADPRVRFLDLPKGPGRGEGLRDAVIRQSAASVITYLGDDDLLFPHHIETMLQCVDGVDFANPLPILIKDDGTLLYVPTDLEFPASIAWHLDPEFRRNSVSLTGATHTRESYLRLPYGWRPAPSGRWADHYMWEQYFQLAGFRARTSRIATTIKFPDVVRGHLSRAERAAEIAQVAHRLSDPEFLAEWNAAVLEAIRLIAVKIHTGG